MKSEIKQRIEQINNGIVPDGYKKTEFGVFPCDWSEKEFKDICDVYSGGTPNTKNAEYWDGDICWCVPTDITSSGKYISCTERKITPKGLENSSAMLMPANSILMCSRATIGPRSINTIPMATNQGFKNLICKNGNNTEFVFQYIEILINSLIQKSSGSTFLELSKSTLENMSCTVPKTKEQEKIAEILMKWDEAIELQEKYIEKLKLKRKSMLQKVFPTDKSNTTIKLGDYLIQCTNRNKANIDNVKSVSNIRGFIDQKDQFSKEVASEDLSNYKVVKKGNIAYNPSRINVGSIAIYEDENPGIVSPMYVVFSCNGISPKYLLLLLESCRGKYEIKSYLSGSVRDSLSFEDLCDISLPIPAMAQEIIVCVFEEIEKVISHNNDLLQKMIDQRKALQQYLLNGIVRVNDER